MIEKYALLKAIKGIIRDDGEFSIHDVARRVKISPSTSKEMLDFLLTRNVLQKRKVGKNLLFKVKNTFLTRQIKILYSIAELSSSGFIDELLDKNNGIISIILYGSVAKGEDTDKSDIDILAVSRKKLEIKELKSEKRISREVTILNYTHGDWKKKAATDKAFYYNVILNCIPLYGEKPVVE